jgi:hypothetical protein
VLVAVLSNHQPSEYAGITQVAAAARATVSAMIGGRT